MWIKFFVPEDEFERDEWTDGPSVVFGGIEQVSGSDIGHQVVYERITRLFGAPGEPTYVTYAGNDEPVDVKGIQGHWCLVEQPEVDSGDVNRG